VKFLKPIDGDVLFTTADGYEENGSLMTTVTLSAAPGCTVTVNGAAAREKDGIYTAQVRLDWYRNALEARVEETGERETAYVYWFRNGYKTYRLGVDDVTRCFENIYRHQEEYTSIFPDPYLDMFRQLHETYGTCVHMHLFYESVDGSFNLSMFPDKYKPEFQANGHWLKLTFHSKAEFPDSPYKHASYEQVYREGKQVEAEILRFAGREVMSNITSQHYADSNLQATRAFRNLGFHCIDAYFIFDENGEPDISYYLNKEQVLHATRRDFWVDNQEDIIFVKDDIILDQVPLEQIERHMEEITAAENHCFHYLLVHEQYFYPDYPRYRPDYKQRIFTAVDWCHRHGYRPVAMSDIIFEPNLADPQ